MDDNKLWAAFWTALAAVVLVLSFTVSSCTREQNLRQQIVAEKCIASGHRYVDAGNGSTYGLCI